MKLNRTNLLLVVGCWLFVESTRFLNNQHHQIWEGSELGIGQSFNPTPTPNSQLPTPYSLLPTPYSPYFKQGISY
ncbi:MAG TPA: hypothetical protein DCP31_34825 [Cyanobacteria bacterium UBA8543]|nr:hypothetical protein [Cyanobacteria bacterium UBA8543]